MSGYHRDPKYQQLLNSKKWKELRASYMSQHPLCERCLEEGRAAGIPEGYVTPAVDCHHIVPVESATSDDEMVRLAYNPNNLRALCISCHQRTHQEMGKNRKENVKQRQDQFLERWKERMEARLNSGDKNPRGPV